MLLNWLWYLLQNHLETNSNNLVFKINNLHMVYMMSEVNQNYMEVSFSLKESNEDFD